MASICFSNPIFFRTAGMRLTKGIPAKASETMTTSISASSSAFPRTREPKSRTRLGENSATICGSTSSLNFCSHGSPIRLVLLFLQEFLVILLKQRKNPFRLCHFFRGNLLIVFLVGNIFAHIRVTGKHIIGVDIDDLIGHELEDPQPPGKDIDIVEPRDLLAPQGKKGLQEFLHGLVGQEGGGVIPADGHVFLGDLQIVQGLFEPFNRHFLGQSRHPFAVVSSPPWQRLLSQTMYNTMYI